MQTDSIEAINDSEQRNTAPEQMLNGQTLTQAIAIITLIGVTVENDGRRYAPVP
ncbi:hypothetical protein [Photorhabdus sp. RM96S]|uniref:hypothetical protein n=1 Tax=Photorhabdus sp. RM96S TaxID=3342822 RepID=UPI0036DEAA8E